MHLGAGLDAVGDGIHELRLHNAPLVVPLLEVRVWEPDGYARHVDR
jgi:hypothetical protein